MGLYLVRWDISLVLVPEMRDIVQLVILDWMVKEILPSNEKKKNQMKMTVLISFNALAYAASVISNCRNKVLEVNLLEHKRRLRETPDLKLDHPDWKGGEVGCCGRVVYCLRLRIETYQCVHTLAHITGRPCWRDGRNSVFELQITISPSSPHSPPFGLLTRNRKAKCVATACRIRKRILLSSTETPISGDQRALRGQPTL